MNTLTWLGARHLARTPAPTIHDSNTSAIPRLIFQILQQRGTTVSLEGHLLTMLAVTVTSPDFSIVADIRETQQYLTPYREESGAQGCTTVTDSSGLLRTVCARAYVSLGTDSFISYLSGQNQLTCPSTESISSSSKDIYNTLPWFSEVAKFNVKAVAESIPQCCALPR